MKTFTETKKALQSEGIILRKTEDGSLVVYLKGAPERQHYYTNDLDDAFQTGRLMLAERAANTEAAEKVPVWPPKPAVNKRVANRRARNNEAGTTKYEKREGLVIRDTKFMKHLPDINLSQFVGRHTIGDIDDQIRKLQDERAYQCRLLADQVTELWSRSEITAALKKARAEREDFYSEA